MNGHDKDRAHGTDGPLGCTDCRGGLQEYLDGTLDKTTSLRFFLHLRDCADCATEHRALQDLFTALDNLPDHPVPEDFDTAILASVPYDAYRAMEPIRRERVPVYLEEHFLPAAVRAPATRLAGGAVSILAVGAAVMLEAPTWWPAAAVVGLVPELLVRAQGLGRLMFRLGRAEG